MTKCQLCKRTEADWAMQFIGEERPTFTTLGSHYRGFAVTKVCSDCQAVAQAAADLLTEGVCVYLPNQAGRLNDYLAQMGRPERAVADSLLGITYRLETTP